MPLSLQPNQPTDRRQLTRSFVDSLHGDGKVWAMQLAPHTGCAFIGVNNNDASILGRTQDSARAKGNTQATLFAPFAEDDHPPPRKGWFGPARGLICPVRNRFHRVSCWQSTIRPSQARSRPTGRSLSKYDLPSGEQSVTKRTCHQDKCHQGNGGRVSQRIVPSAVPRCQPTSPQQTTRCQTEKD
jgi:hypothetical protein